MRILLIDPSTAKRGRKLLKSATRMPRRRRVRSFHAHTQFCPSSPWNQGFLLHSYTGVSHQVLPSGFHFVHYLADTNTHFLSFNQRRKTAPETCWRVQKCTRSVLGVRYDVRSDRGPDVLVKLPIDRLILSAGLFPRKKGLEWSGPALNKKVRSYQKGLFNRTNWFRLVLKTTSNVFQRSVTGSRRRARP